MPRDTYLGMSRQPWRHIVSLVMLLGRPIGACDGSYALPAFHDYPAPRIYEGAKASLQLRKGTDAWRFRTMIRAGYRDTRINFAGHYVAITWGCGTLCQNWAYVDARTGRVYVLPFPTSVGAAYRIDSQLFIADPQQCAGNECIDLEPLKSLFTGAYTTHYRWSDGVLQPIHPVAAHGSPTGTPMRKRLPGRRIP